MCRSSSEFRMWWRAPVSVAHAEAAVDGDDRAGDVRGVVGREEADDGGDVLGSAETLQRDELLRGVADVVGEFGGHVRLDEAGRDDVGRDRPRAEFAGHRAGQADDAGLRGRVVDLPRLTGHADDRAEEDHPAPAPSQHRAVGALRAPERTGEVGVDDLRELVLRHPHQQRVVGDAGVRDQNLDRSLVLFDLLERGVDGVAVGDVAADGEQPVRGAGAAVGDGDPVAVRLQAAGDGEADATVATGDENRAGGGRGARRSGGAACVSHGVKPYLVAVRVGNKAPRAAGGPAATQVRAGVGAAAGRRRPHR
ncbi:conserved hypothetical protein [Rhodococcus ruber]|uniref:Uncharacterized protein n=1 Tax=Rhodococcus ruber TaxID=1830 RepID=A0A098BJL2_9NOCA|nr:conserved hypothetical protein [Rhodococcus ruber]